jgi:hypothetical protein
MTSTGKAKAIVRELGDLLAPHQGWKRQVSAVHAALISERFDDRIEQLTWNRVKAWFYGEARRVDFDEMVSLKNLKASEEAKCEHRKFLEETGRLAKLLALEGAALDRNQVAALARISRRSAALVGANDAGTRGKRGGMDRAGVAAA